MATVHRINAACTEVISNDECHVLLIYTSISNDIVRHTVETQQEEFLFSDPKFKIALAWASERVEDMACPEPDCDDSDDGFALASAGFGMDEDYGSCQDF